MRSGFRKGAVALGLAMLLVLAVLFRPGLLLDIVSSVLDNPYFPAFLVAAT